MFECDRRGVLRTVGRPWTIQELARTTGVTPKVIEELINNGVMRVSKRTKTMW